MNNFRRSVIQIIFVISVALPVIAPSAGGAADCIQIPMVPFVISGPGSYCLTGDMEKPMQMGTAVTINSDNVLLDLGGYRIDGGDTAKTGQAFGIYAISRKNIIIRNGTIRGFMNGITITEGTGTPSQGNVIENIRTEMNWSVGMLVTGRGNIVRRNQVIDIGGSELQLSPGFRNSYGIYVSGHGARILDNDIFDIKEHGGGEAVGIAVSSDGALVQNNRIGNPLVGGEKKTSGIRVFKSKNVLVINNRVTGMPQGINFDSKDGKYRDNATAGVALPYSGGKNIGNNN